MYMVPFWMERGGYAVDLCYNETLDQYRVFHSVPVQTSDSPADEHWLCLAVSGPMLRLARQNDEQFINSLSYLPLEWERYSPIGFLGEEWQMFAGLVFHYPDEDCFA